MGLEREKKTIGVIGAGAWGTAFSMHLAGMGYHVLLWVYEEDLYRILKKERENRYYLPGFKLSGYMDFAHELTDIPAYSDDIVIATPSFALRETLERVSHGLQGKRILILTKGIEINTYKFMADIVHELIGRDEMVAVLSGPSFAREVAKGQFTSVVVASRIKSLSKYFQSLIHSDNFRVYTNEDVVGVELGGAMKNVMAIGAGIIEGLELGTNTKAAFVTRALAEIRRLGRALGARDTTFMGLSGIGDLILTSYGSLSRNRAFGLELARGRTSEEIIGSQNAVVEGYFTIKAAYLMSRNMGVAMPITEELYRIVYERKDILESIRDIKNRGLKEEDE
ncbi:MAG TPA: NAD(P)H-dependent glycerol-3-phosphate dehydrogenase [Syntrophorhabdaceae bacterium]|mgnify:CR=1 FL=1|nr:NAD(P)H-dependent glycerol-3-phosphate dehydrogenase [Syntrophorhabdaceae bacterium]HPC66100.1 NAD(P)H-dependent glycerol-3-phosphate dehydrogenase [Syntrophorhabdaceae bacterium]HPP41094.1 NAD(P)H-dependent glycerol-3-phosphate dehydrogenase [Syntrophorhabdaceae bacterium]HQK46026.1 NAD(P)H-dependent glycerol-3-phosphate dehydrogenase [Syntrophorhabdaceae bacterium]HRR71401.1 NAD(P)H-dependent glycerol-3-phosphate dehydrogenase [Syntrophorhabdaceae bacterium]